MDYKQLARQLVFLLQGETDQVAILANTAALLMTELENVSWAGFYLEKEGELILGPFQGKPACIHIPLGKGVCGTAFVTRQTLRVPDVHAFSGHIACDSESASEIVIPLSNRSGKLIGVMDLDSKKPDRFSEDDQAGLEMLAVALREFL
ncbi:MAG TPA: GAF domain-containing protein [Flexilinea sp.]|jgi:GAF domain-containing protein|nr:MAG: Free methionine-R-sulfoxide reductase [Chloroflexi bacterium ADurb.Bin344]HNY94956.1 GAF domain-containing protein [Flexilinea sp.]HPB40230.1 GAF domain-containing protein [Flexilinea sp.]HQF80611.1 GAF domain-containing protein [Flexilinea sp.]HQJ01928.1 GAF domain-containing protein [Flexilinea sp.]